MKRKIRSILALILFLFFGLRFSGITFQVIKDKLQELISNEKIKPSEFVDFSGRDIIAWEKAMQANDIKTYKDFQTKFNGSKNFYDAAFWITTLQRQDSISSLLNDSGFRFQLAERDVLTLKLKADGLYSVNNKDFLTTSDVQERLMNFVINPSRIPSLSSSKENAKILFSADKSLSSEIIHKNYLDILSCYLKLWDEQAIQSHGKKINEGLQENYKNVVRYEKLPFNIFKVKDIKKKLPPPPPEPVIK